MSNSSGVLRDDSGVLLAAFGSFLEHQLILFVELMAILESLDIFAWLGFFVLEVEFDLATAIFRANSQGSMQWDFSYLICWIRALSSSPSSIVKYIFRETTSTTYFMAN